MQFVIRTYGLLDPINWTDECESEMRLMTELWNKLLDLNERYILNYLSFISKDIDFTRALDEYDLLVSLTAQPFEITASKKRLAIAQKEAGKRMAAELRTLESERREAVKIARQNSGLWWGNYNAVVSSFERARSAAIRSGNTIRRRSADDNGRITNTLQGGADVDAIFDGSQSQLSLRPLTGGAWSAASRGERRRLQRTTLSATIFVRDGERRTVSWPMVMHRPIPPDCRVKKLTVTRRRVNSRWKWAASFLCTRLMEDIRSRPAFAKVAALDIGWRRVPEGLRVATLVTRDEPPSFINLPQDLLASFALIDELRARVRIITLRGLDLLQGADTLAYEQPFRDMLREYQVMPEKKFVDLRKFCNEAFFMDQSKEEIGTELLDWRKEFKRLTFWLENQQRKVVSRRNHFYQNAAIDILKNLSEIVVNDLKLGEIAARKPMTTGATYFPNRAHHYRIVAATSELVRALKLQAAKRGVTFIKREADFPVGCPNCGSTCRKTRSDVMPQICNNCKTSFDQDVAAGQSLLPPEITYR